MRRFLLLLALLLAGATAGASAQVRATVTISLDSSGRQPLVQLKHLFDDQQWRQTVDDGIALRVSWRVELWKKGGFITGDHQISRAEWSFSVQRKATLGLYESRFVRVGYSVKSEVDASLDLLNLRSVGALLPPKFLVPTERGEYYYSVEVRITTLDSQDVDDVFRFQGQDNANLFDALSRMVSHWSIPGVTLPRAKSASFRIR